ncbi:MAG: acyltransferase [Pseudolabrys sp.]|nr:acyltransferase [Pseudolabrys sp.]
MRLLWAGLILLAASAALPVLRPIYFADHFELYAFLRVALLVAFGLLIYWGGVPAVRVKRQPVQRLNIYDPLLSLRAFACWLVVAGHGLVVVVPEQARMALLSENPLYRWLIPEPWFGVWVFFVLSGYLMGKAFYSGRYRFDREGAVGFYQNRFLRIAPLYLISTFAIGYLLSNLSIPNATHWLLLAIFDTDGVAVPTPNTVLWSVATEMQFYLAVPFLAPALARAAGRHLERALALMLAILVAAFIYRYLWKIYGTDYWGAAVYAPLIGNIDLFLSGMILAYVIQVHRPPAPPLWAGFVLMAALYVVATLAFVVVLSGHEKSVLLVRFLSQTPTAIGTLAIVWCFESRKEALSGVWRAIVGWTAPLGILTYGIYAWHAGIMMFLSQWLTSSSRLPEIMLFFAVEIALAIFLAWLSWRLIEKNSHRFKSRTAHARALTPPAP